MKNRTLYLIFFAIYVFTFGLGYAFSGLRQASAQSSQPADPRQDNWILVRVDDMSVAQPKLVSVWGMFITFTPGPQLYFKSFTGSGSASARLVEEFSVNPDRTLSDGFLRAIDDLDFRRSGLVIVDDVGFTQVTGWFQQPFELARPLVPLTGPITTGQTEENAFEDICLTVKTPDLARPVSLPWNSLFPTHLIAHPDLAGLQDLWARVINSNIPPHCEVISQP